MRKLAIISEVVNATKITTVRSMSARTEPSAFKKVGKIIPFSPDAWKLHIAVRRATFNPHLIKEFIQR